MVLVQTPPHHSWKNPAERVMSNLNLGLQGIGVMRSRTATLEQPLKMANNLKAIRKLEKTHPTLKQEVNDCIQPAKILIDNYFSRLKIKDNHFKVFHAATEEEMRTLAQQLLKIEDLIQKFS